jgi:hypothetical protein
MILLIVIAILVGGIAFFGAMIGDEVATGHNNGGALIGGIIGFVLGVILELCLIPLMANFHL